VEKEKTVEKMRRGRIVQRRHGEEICRNRIRRIG